MIDALIVIASIGIVCVLALLVLGWLSLVMMFAYPPFDDADYPDGETLERKATSNRR